MGQCLHTPSIREINAGGPFAYSAGEDSAINKVEGVCDVLLSRSVIHDELVSQRKAEGQKINQRRGRKPQRGQEKSSPK